MTRGARNLIVLAAAALAMATFVGVVLLQRQATGYRQAQETLANAQTQFVEASVTVLGLTNHLQSPSTTRQEMFSSELGVNAAIASLRRGWPVPALVTSASLLNGDFKNLNTLAGVLFRDPQLQNPSDTLELLRIGLPITKQTVAAKAAMEEANHQYAQRASRAQEEALAGTFLALALLLGAFLVFFTRWGKLLDSTHRDARTDALTGLGNRRALIEALETELPAATEQRPLVLTLYDLDGFKAYNDSFGHLAGDALLARVAARLQETVGAGGNAYRMGGDEFCGLVSLSPGQVDAHIEASRNALTEAGDGFEIGCSAGCVLVPHEADSPPRCASQTSACTSVRPRRAGPRGT